MLVGEVGVSIVAMPGLPIGIDQVPVPMALRLVPLLVIVALSGPAFGLAVTVTATVSDTDPTVQIKW